MLMLGYAKKNNGSIKYITKFFIVPSKIALKMAFFEWDKKKVEDMFNANAYVSFGGSDARR